MCNQLCALLRHHIIWLRWNNPQTTWEKQAVKYWIFYSQVCRCLNDVLNNHPPLPDTLRLPYKLRIQVCMRLYTQEDDDKGWKALAEKIGRKFLGSVVIHLGPVGRNASVVIHLGPVDNNASVVIHLGPVGMIASVVIHLGPVGSNASVVIHLGPVGRNASVVIHLGLVGRNASVVIHLGPVGRNASVVIHLGPVGRNTSVVIHLGPV